MQTNRRVTASMLLALSPLSQSATADHWKHVPPLATSCFNDDKYQEKLDAARTTVQAEIEKQKKINEAAREKFDNMDMMEKAQRMQAFMAKDPQAAMRMMQNEQAAGNSIVNGVSAANESAKRLDAELMRHQASMRAALEQAAKPHVDQRSAFIKARTVRVGEAAEPAFTNVADHAQYVKMVEDENSAVEKACASYFGASGAMHKWLESYRTEVSDKLINDGAETDIVTAQMAAMDLPGGKYKSTIGLEQTINYMQKIRNIYDARPNRARATLGMRK